MEILRRIEEEQTLVNGNKKLIEIYEQKIKRGDKQVVGGVMGLTCNIMVRTKNYVIMRNLITLPSCTYNLKNEITKI